MNGKKVVIDSSNEPINPTLPQVPVQVQQGIIQQPVDDENYDYLYAAQPDPTPVTPVQVQQPLIDPTVYTGIQHDITTVNRVAKQVYMKMYNFIFRSCGQLKDSDMGFSNPEAVCTTPIPLTTEESTIFTSMNHLDINGRWCTDVSTTGGLFGKVMKNTKLPAYEVNLHINGITHKRLFMPQNPAKQK